MKKTILLVLFSLLILSCGNEPDSVESLIEKGDVTQLREKKAELNKQQAELSKKIDLLDAEIKKLDPNKNFALVTTQKIKDTIFKHYAEVQGDVATDENIVVYPESAGILKDVRVDEGQKVSKGQILAIVDDGGLSSELARLKTQAALAKTTFERQERLWEQNIGSEIQYLQAKANYEALNSSINQVQSQLGKSIIRAPFAGIIDEVYTEQGVVVAPGQNQLFRLISLKNMFVEAEVPESYFGKIGKNTEVLVEIASLNKTFKGEINRVGNNINPNNRTFTIEIAIPNEDGMIVPNQIATVKFNDYSKENAIIIPENIVQRNATGKSIVYTLKIKDENSGVVQENVIETGYSYNESVEITEGLESGDIIILEGSKNLRDGQEVTVRNQVYE
ncbi:MAG TPA: efflux RND transporter periplasmic adaptor subunit [Salinimicrobium sp.]|nr:efflux RND transporter periplasmic adaptor subunit [Salinimicrobium sp.]